MNPKVPVWTNVVAKSSLFSVNAVRIAPRSWRSTASRGTRRDERDQRARGGGVKRLPGPAEPVPGARVDVRPLPELEHEQAPEPVAVVGAAGDVVGEQPLHGRRPELAARPCPLAEQQVAGERAQLAAEPARDRHAEAGLPAPGDLGRERVGEGPPERHLPARPCTFSESGSETPSSSTSWSRSGERSSSECAIEAMSALSEQVAGEVRAHVEELEPGDPAARRRAEQLARREPGAATNPGSQSSARSAAGNTSISRP